MHNYQMSAYIKKLRKRKDLKAEQLAEKVGVSLTTLKYWESGRYIPSFANSCKLAAILDVDVKDMLRAIDISREERATELIEKNKKEIRKEENTSYAIKHDIYRKF